MWIRREMNLYLKCLSKNRPSLLLTGPRQSGKTSLLIKTFPHADFISLDLPSNAEEAETSGQEFLAKLKKPVIIDEVQYAPKLFRYLKHEIDQNRNQACQYILSGSQKFSLMHGITESLSGRIAIVELHPLSIREVCLSKKTKLSFHEVFNFILKGGYPEIYEKDLLISEFFSSYLTTYLERDVRQLVQVRSLRDFNRFMRLCASRCGQLVSANSLANDVGVSVNTIKGWLSVLEASNIIALLPPYFKNIGKRMVKAPKLYFLDTGLACFLNGVETIEELHRFNLAGAMFENHVFCELTKLYANQGKQAPLYYFRDHNGVEIDFIVAKANAYHLIECKIAETVNVTKLKSFQRIEKIEGKNKILSQSVITPYPSSRKLKNSDIRIENSYDFKFLNMGVSKTRES